MSVGSARWCLRTRSEERFDLDRLADPDYDIGPYATIRRRGRGFGVRGSRHTVTLPSRPSQKLSILYGLLSGDGSLIDYSSAAKWVSWRIDFAESDPAVIEEYVRLTREIFNITASIRKRDGWFEAYFSNKIVYRFYSRILGHPTGRKTGLLRIPDAFKGDSRLLLGFLRGLFTAEGSVKLEANVRIAMTMQEPVLIEEGSSILDDAGFHPHRYSYSQEGRRLYGVYVYGVREASLFKERIGFIGRKADTLKRAIQYMNMKAVARESPVE